MPKSFAATNLPPNLSKKEIKQPEKLRVGLLLLDTTWRIAIPVLLMSAIGLYFDFKLKVVPWLTILGMIIGFIFAILLIKQLLAATEEKL